ncbi:CASP-like protein PIMP1 [Lycium barbarum]|uniref:CASP-like protein PIMP1 n=1 Tax=Lycium barbarum TaxID=112863 RepID=UPI00293E55C8|nr:CASP-like protein PIMP1 [Lycium barbarum]
MDQNQTPSTTTMDQTSTTTMNQNQTSSTSAVSPMMVGLKPLMKPLAIRAITFIFLFVSLIVIATDSFETSETLETLDEYDFTLNVKANVKSSDFSAYRYMISADAIGMAYTLLIVWLTISHVKSGSPIDSGLAYFEFYSDKVILFLLSTGAAAGLGLTVEFNRVTHKEIISDKQKFINMANASASLLLLGSISSFISSVVSSLNLPKRC